MKTQFHLFIYLLLISLIVGCGKSPAKPEAKSDFWQKIGLDSMFVRSLAIENNRIYAGTHHTNTDVGGKLFYSDDNGLSWEESSFSSYIETGVIYSIAVKTNYIFIGCEGGNWKSSDGIAYSSDNGDTWSNVDLNSSWVPSYGEIRDIKIDSEGHIFARGGMCNLFYSEDYGLSWELISEDQCGNSIIINEQNQLFMDGYGQQDHECDNYGVYCSSDTGKTWTLAFHTTCESINSLIISNSVIYLLLSDEIYSSADNGLTWTNHEHTGLYTSYLYCLVVAADNKIFTGGINGAFCLNIDNSWEEISSGLEEESAIYALGISGNYIFAGTKNGIYRSIESLE